VTTLKLQRPSPVASGLVACVCRAVALASRFLHLATHRRAADVADRRPFVDMDATWKDATDEVAATAAPAIKAGGSVIGTVVMLGRSPPASGLPVSAA
jgi:hypothetical protein